MKIKSAKKVDSWLLKDNGAEILEKNENFAHRNSSLSIKLSAGYLELNKENFPLTGWNHEGQIFPNIL